jgi:uncharacterized alpha/beta hydrolase family protein
MKLPLIFTTGLTYLFSANIVFVHGLNSNSNTFWKMAKEIAKAKGEKQILKIGYEAQILDNEYCYDENGDLISCNNEEFTSTNTLAKIIYGLKDDQFETKNLYYKILDLNETNLSIPKENILPTDFKTNIHTILINFSNNKNLSFEAQGKELGVMLNKIKDITNEKDFILIGHSMGGIAIREYMQKFFDNNITIDGIITIATPHKGIDYEDILGIAGASGKNLKSNSEDMTILNSVNLDVYKTIPFIAFRITGYNKGLLNGDLISGSYDDGVVSGDSQVPPFDSYIIDFKPNCSIDENYCISTINPIYHTKETENPLIINEVKKFVANQIKLNKGWNLISGEFKKFNLKSVKLAWKYDTNWSVYSNNETLKEKISSYGYEFFNQANNNQGIWIYSNEKKELLNIKNNATLNYTYNKGWTLSGTNKEINASIIKCENNSIPIIWEYKNNSWRVYYQNKKEFNKLAKNSGFWVRCF